MILFIQGSWRAIAFRALVALAFGIAALVWPGLTLLALVLLFGAFVLVDGVTHLVAAFRARDEGGGADSGRGDRVWLVLQGVLSVGVGVITFVWPAITALALVIVIAAWALLTGVFELIAAVRMRRAIDNEWLLVIGGVLAVAAGVLMAVRPDAGALAITWLIGWFAVFRGVLLLGLAWRVRQLTEATAHGRGRARPTPMRPTTA
jgi:uncharacterized membrane protein HdeD (DUF308 family)